MSGFTCATCAETVSVDTFAPWRCPNEQGDRHHVLLINENDQHVVENHHNPFIAFRRNMMWWQFAQARGMSDERAIALVQSVDDEIAKIGGVGFTRTPMLFQSTRLHNGYLNHFKVRFLKKIKLVLLLLILL